MDVKRASLILGACLFALVVGGCGGDNDSGQFITVSNKTVEILSDPNLDGDITLDLASNSLSAPSFAVNTGSVLAGVNLSPTGTPISETRGFLAFPLGALPSNASIQFASISIFIDAVSFATTSTAPIPFLLESMDTISFPVPIVSSDFDSPYRMSESVPFFGRDAGTFVNIDVTSLLVDAQARLLSQFEIRFVFDQATFQSAPRTTRGLIEIDDQPANPSRAPLLRIEYF